MSLLSMAHPYTSHKLDPRSSLCVFVGYSDTQSAYYCLDPISNKIYVSLYVKFIEHSLPFSSSSMTAPPHTSSDTDEWCALYIPIISFAPTISVPSLQKKHSALSSLSFLGHWCQLYHPISSHGLLHSLTFSSSSFSTTPYHSPTKQYSKTH